MVEVAEEVSSAEVVADAAKALKSGDVQEAVKGFSGGADDEPEEQEGRTDEPADDAAKEGEDYNPEDQAEYVDDDGEPLAAEATTSEPTEELTEAQQAALSGKSQAEIADALMAASQTAEETAVTPATEPVAQPSEEAGDPDALIRGAVETLMREDPNVARQVGELGTLRDTLEARHKQITENQTEIAELTSRIDEDTAVLKYLEAQSKEDPDDVMVLEKAREHRINLNDLRSRRSDLKSETVSQQSEQRVDRQDYGAGLSEIQGLGRGVLDRGAQQARAEVTYKEHHADATTELNNAIPKVMQEWGLSDDMKGFIEDEIGLWSQHATDEDLRAGNLENWIRSLQPRIVPKFEKVRSDALKGYAELKRGDALQPAPEAAAAAAKERPSGERVLSSKEADRQAARSMRNALRKR